MAQANGNYKVVLTLGAEQDLETLFDYIAENDSAPMPTGCWTN